MIPVSIVWFREDEEPFEKHLPLQWGGQRIMGFDEKNRPHLVFLEGLAMLLPSYFEDSDFSAIFSTSGYWKEGVFV
jgi:hypothetical protein